MEQMNTVNHIAICVLILLVLFVTNGVGGNYLPCLLGDNDDTPAIEKVEALPHSIPTNYHSSFPTFFLHFGEHVVDISPTQNSSSVCIRD